MASRSFGMQWARTVANGPSLAAHRMTVSNLVGCASALRPRQASSVAWAGPSPHALVGGAGSLARAHPIPTLARTVPTDMHSGLNGLGLSAASRAGILPTGGSAVAGQRHITATAHDAAPSPVESKPTPAPAPDKSKFAVVRVGGKQYKVTEHDSVVVENRKGLRVGAALAQIARATPRSSGRPSRRLSVVSS